MALSQDRTKKSHEEEMVREMAKVAFAPWIQEPAELARIMREESARWGRLIRDNNIKVE